MKMDALTTVCRSGWERLLNDSNVKTTQQFSNQPPSLSSCPTIADILCQCWHQNGAVFERWMIHCVCNVGATCWCSADDQGASPQTKPSNHFFHRPPLKKAVVTHEFLSETSMFTLTINRQMPLNKSFFIWDIHNSGLPPVCVSLSLCSSEFHMQGFGMFWFKRR